MLVNDTETATFYMILFLVNCYSCYRAWEYRND